MLSEEKGNHQYPPAAIPATCNSVLPARNTGTTVAQTRGEPAALSLGLRPTLELEATRHCKSSQEPETREVTGLRETRHVILLEEYSNTITHNNILVCCYAQPSAEKLLLVYGN